MIDTQRREGELILQSMGGGQVSLTIDGDASDNGNHTGRSVNHHHPFRHSALVVVSGEKITRFGGSCRAPPDVGKIVRPRVDELQHVVAVVRIGHVQHQRTVPHIAQRDQVQRVVVG